MRPWSRFVIHDGAHLFGVELFSSWQTAMEIAQLGTLVVDTATGIGYVGV